MGVLCGVGGCVVWSGCGVWVWHMEWVDYWVGVLCCVVWSGWAMGGWWVGVLCVGVAYGVGGLVGECVVLCGVSGWWVCTTTVHP